MRTRHLKWLLPALLALLAVCLLLPAAQADDGEEWIYEECPVGELGQHDISWEDIQREDCTHGAITIVTCRFCGKTHKFVGEAPGHQWDDGAITKEPTCTEDGEVIYSCTRVNGNIICGATRTESIPALGHDWDDGKVTQEPTADAEGVRTYTCKRDPSHTKTEPIPRLDPAPVTDPPVTDPPVTDPPITDPPVTKVPVTDPPAPTHEHKWGEWVEIEKGTCVKKARYRRVCSCGAEEYKDGEYGSHDWGSWHVVKEPTATKPGKKERVCKIESSHKQEKEIPPTGVEAALTLTWDVSEPTEPYDPDDGVSFPYTVENTGKAELDLVRHVEYGNGDSITDDKSVFPAYAGFVPGQKWNGDVGYAPVSSRMTPGTETEELSGTVTVIVWCEGYDPATGEKLCESNVLSRTVKVSKPVETVLTLTAEKTVIIKPVYHETDQIYYKVTLTNDSTENVSVPVVDVRWVESDSLVKTFSNPSIVLAPGESIEFNDTDHILFADVVNGQLTFEFSGQATRVSDGTTVYSNKASVTWPTEAEPPVDAEYSLLLEVYKTNPKSDYYLDGYGYTEEIPYYAVVTNTSNVPIRFSELNIAINGGTGGTHTEPEQFLMPGDWYDFYIYGTTLHESQVAPGTETTEAYGIVTLSFTAVCGNGDNGDPVCNSNTVDLDHTLLKEIPPWTPDFTGVVVDKFETSYHLNPLGYMLDEVITYDIIVTNTGDLPISSLEVHDSLYDDGSGSDVLAVMADLQPAESRVVSFSHVVTQDDVDAGWVYNTATATWKDPVTETEKSEPSLTVKSPTTKEPLPGGLEIVKSVISTPDNGLYYTPGETITFHIAVTNTMDTDINDIWTYDTYNPPVYVGHLLPHDTFEWSYDYVATDHPDADIGYVSNTAYADGFAPDGFKTAVSNEVTVPVHRNPPKAAQLLLTKAETSQPANGSYYVLDEEIVYTITAENIGEAVLYDICLFDSLDNPPAEYAHIGVLNPGEKHSVTYTYKVTQPDVDAGYVENWAIADYWAEGDSSAWFSVYAGPVISPTCENPIIKKTSLIPGKADSCRLTLRNVGIFTLAEEQHYCAVHRETAEQVAELTAAAVTDAEKTAAWQQGVSIWREALEAEYSDLMAAAQGVVRLSLMEEKAAFENYIEKMNAMLQALYPDDPALVSRMICEALEKQCTELCYLHSNAGKARPDSMISGRYKVIEGDAAAAECIRSASPTRTGGILLTRTLCEEHSKLQNTVINLAEGAVNRTAAVDVFLRIRRVWQTALDQATNQKCKTAEGDAKLAVAQFRMALDKLLEKEADLLNRLYPVNPEIVAEVISNIVRNQVLTLCGTW